MKKKIKDLTKKEIANICGKHSRNYCEKCPLIRPSHKECEYDYIHDLLEHYDKEIEINESDND